MKRILLASTAIVAFAGAAAADGHATDGVSFSGDAEFGYNDEFDNGFFWSVGASLAYSATLNNGLTAAVSGDVEFNNDDNSTLDGNEITIDDLVITLSSDMASLAFGDTPPAADALFSSPVTNLDADGFADEGDASAVGEDGIIIGRVTVGPAELGVSYYVFSSDEGPNDDFQNLQLGGTATLGTVDVTFGYQEGGTTGDGVTGPGTVDLPQIFAIGASTTLAGVELGFAYADNETVESIGVQGAYTIGDVTATVFYVSQDSVDDNYGIALDYASGPITVGFLFHDGNDEDLQLNVTYDVGNGLELFGGYRDERENSAGLEGSEVFYVGGDYDLGGDATLRISYADVTTGPGDDLTLDELGAAEDVKEGVTVAVSFSF
ncbi:MAG: porin [Pseudomonadota bacterium]